MFVVVVENPVLLIFGETFFDIALTRFPADASFHHPRYLLENESP